MIHPITISIYHQRWPKRPDEIYPVNIRVTYKRKRKYYGAQFGIRVRISKSEFKSLTGKRALSGPFKRERAAIDKAITQIRQAADQIPPFQFSFEELERILFDTGNGDPVLLTDALAKYAGAQEKTKTADVYRLTAKTVAKYKRGVDFSRVDQHFLNSFEGYMKKAGMSDSTAAIHLRNIRTVYNEAIRKGVVTAQDYPFGRGRYIIPSSTRAKKLTALPDLKKLFAFHSDDPDLQFARDVYMFSFFTGGANPKDLFLLQKENIQHQQIIFRRGKSGSTVEVPLIETTRRILRRYQGGLYLFPIYRGRVNEKQATRRAGKARKNINRSLRTITGKKTTLHEARHSFATYANSVGMTGQMIAHLMGHSQGITGGYMSFPLPDKIKWLEKLEKYLE